MTPSQRAYLMGFWDGEADRIPDQDRFKTKAERSLYRRGYIFAMWCGRS